MGLTVDDDEGDKLVDAGVSIDVVVVSGRLIDGDEDEDEELSDKSDELSGGYVGAVDKSEELSGGYVGAAGLGASFAGVSGSVSGGDDGDGERFLLCFLRDLVVGMIGGKKGRCRSVKTGVSLLLPKLPI